MQDGCFSFVNQPQVLIDIIDEDWLTATIPTEEIGTLPENTEDSELHESGEFVTEENTWADLGLHEFATSE
jgi:hypothetical protein